MSTIAALITEWGLKYVIKIINDCIEFALGYDRSIKDLQLKQEALGLIPGSYPGLLFLFQLAC